MARGPLDRLLTLFRQRTGRRPDAPAGSPPLAGVPPGSDWAWRPGAFRAPGIALPAGRLAPGQSLGDGLTVFHDCPAQDVTLAAPARQGSRGGASRAAPRGIVIEVGQFTGTYLSLVMDLPAPVARSLTRRHLLSLRADLALSGPTDGYARLNLRHGPNTDTVVRKVVLGPAPDTRGSGLGADFDLATVAFDANRLTAAWVDLILSQPAGLQIDLRDIVLSRRLRAML